MQLAKAIGIAVIAELTLKMDIVHGRSCSGVEGLRGALNWWAWFCNNERMRTTLGMSPVEFRKAGLSL